MSSICASPKMASYVTGRIDNIETYQAIQLKKEEGYRLKGYMILPQGKIHLIFYEVKKAENCKVFLSYRGFRPRSFSSYQ